MLVGKLHAQCSTDETTVAHLDRLRPRVSHNLFACYFDCVVHCLRKCKRHLVQRSIHRPSCTLELTHVEFNGDHCPSAFFDCNGLDRSSMRKSPCLAA